MAQTTPPLELKQAELMTRLLNSAFNNVTGYGPGHQITQRAIESFVEQLTLSMQGRESLTLMLDHDSLYLEQHCVDRKLNSKKLTTTFKKLGLQSISFYERLTADHLRYLLIILSDNKSFADVDAARDELQRRKVETLRLNYVVFRKVTADEAVVGKDGLETLAAVQSGQAVLSSPDEVAADRAAAQTPAAPPAEAAAPQAPAAPPRPDAFVRFENESLEKISAVFSLKELLENPDRVAEAVLRPGGDITDEQKSDMVERLKRVNREIRDGAMEGAFVSVDEMMGAVAKLREDLKEGISAQKEVGRFLKEEGAVLTEMDQLTYQTIVRIVRDEYRGGNLTVKRLAQIIRRVLPEVRDLKRLLPQLKESLMAEGMALPDYLQLVTELTNELKSEGLGESLAQAAEATGLTVEEIVEHIRSDPAEAARLVVLAAELRQAGSGGGEDQLSGVLSEYIERVSGRMAVESPEALNRDGGKVLRTVLYRIEKELLERVKAQGISTAVLARVEEQLSGHFQQALDGAKSDWILNLVSRAGDVSGTQLLQVLENVVERQADLANLSDPLRQVLVAQGFSTEKIQGIYGAMAEKLKQKTQMFLLPRNVLSTNNTTYFLQRHVKSYYRYKTPFSCLMLTITAVKAGEEWRSATGRELAQVMPDVFAVLLALLRDLDFIGSMGSAEASVPFIILPMTEQAGADVVRQRIAERLTGRSFTIDGAAVTLRVAVSATSFDRARTPDIKAFVQLLRQRHAEQEAAADKA